MSERITITNTGRYEGSIHLLAEQDGQCVGRSVGLKIGKTVLLEDFRVEDSVRKQGIGSQLLTETERLAIEADADFITRIGMFCDADSIPAYLQAVSFFRKRGYSYSGVTLTKKLEK